MNRFLTYQEVLDLPYGSVIFSESRRRHYKIVYNNGKLVVKIVDSNGKMEKTAHTLSKQEIESDFFCLSNTDKRAEITRKSEMVKKMTTEEKQAYINGLCDKLHKINNQARASWNSNNPFKAIIDTNIELQEKYKDYLVDKKDSRVQEDIELTAKGYFDHEYTAQIA